MSRLQLPQLIGVHEKTVLTWECGKSQPQHSKRILIERHLNSDPPMKVRQVSVLKRQEGALAILG